jgi:hypothetical protein
LTLTCLVIIASSSLVVGVIGFILGCNLTTMAFQEAISSKEDVSLHVRKLRLLVLTYQYTEKLKEKNGQIH